VKTETENGGGGEEPSMGEPGMQGCKWKVEGGKVQAGKPKSGKDC
jgi:hypothetical protein